MPPVSRVNSPSGRNFPAPGAVGGPRGSAMSLPVNELRVPGTSQRNQIIATGATSGGFQIRLQGRGGDVDVTTAVINFNDTLAQVVTKIDAALPVDENVTGISGGPLPAAVVIEFTSEEAYTLTAVNSTLVGGTAVISTTQAATGAVWGPPAPEGRERTFRNMRGSEMARPDGLGR